MVGLLPPDSGEVWVNGKLLGSGGEDFPKDVGILINETGFIGYLSGFQNLKMLAQIWNIIDDETIQETMRSVGLDDTDRTPVRKYSMGMKQKLGIAQAIMENQSIVILDEPYNALDFEANREVTQILERLKGQGKTILLTSHQHQYPEKLCDKI
ncbi:MAG: ABC transporter ATP-binding protein [Oscillospiraceae bacterium]|nr:ABC transporter ATP-binding protein [Oscillospiraceae bacterium]